MQHDEEIIEIIAIKRSFLNFEQYSDLGAKKKYGKKDQLEGLEPTT